MSIKWDLAPETATHYCAGRFYRVTKANRELALYWGGDDWHFSADVSNEHVCLFGEPRPNQPQWTEDDSLRIGTVVLTHESEILQVDCISEDNGVRCSDGRWYDRSMLKTAAELKLFHIDKAWPDETRIDIVATNGNEGLHYPSAPAAAADFLSAGLKILTERGNQYGSEGRECSFPQVAQAFTAITGKPLTGSDVCLILALVKQVRQYAQPERFHEDSAVDGVNYTALQSEQLKRERSK